MSVGGKPGTGADGWPHQKRIPEVGAIWFFADGWLG